MVSNYRQLLEQQYIVPLDETGKDLFKFAVVATDQMRVEFGVTLILQIDLCGMPIESHDLKIANEGYVE